MDTMLVMNGIGTRMKALREELGLTQEQVATAIGVTRAAISGLERGETHTMAWPHLKAAAKFFRCEVEYLAEGKGPRRVRNPAVRWSDDTVDAADTIEEMPDEQRLMVLSLIKQLSQR
jgi:transcriptional regulator with XRE-family HTH domain